MSSKQPDGSWLYQSSPFTPPPLHSEAIGCTLAFEDVYRKVEEEAAAEGEGEGDEA